MIDTRLPQWMLERNRVGDNGVTQSIIAGFQLAQQDEAQKHRTMVDTASMAVQRRQMEFATERALIERFDKLIEFDDMSEVSRAMQQYHGGQYDISPRLKTLTAQKNWMEWKSSQQAELASVAEIDQFTTALKDLDGRGISAVRSVGQFGKGHILPAHWEALDRESRRVSEVAQRTADVKNIETMRLWENQLTQAVEAGDTKLAEDLRDRINRLDAQTAPNNQTVESYAPDGQILSRITTGRGGTKAAGPTIGSQTFFQKRLSSLESSIGQIGELEKVIDPSTVGLRGVIGETVVDRLLGQVAPGVVDVKRADARTKLKATIQGMVRLISTDDRFSNEDRRRAEDAMVSAGALESYERATQTLSTLKGILGRNAAVTAKNAGIARPEWSYTPEDIAAEVQASKMTVEQGEALLNRFYPNWKP